MATDVVCSNMESTVTDQGFRIACLNLPTHFLQSFFVNLGCPPAPTADEAKAAKVHPVETVEHPIEGVVAKEQS